MMPGSCSNYARKFCELTDLTDANQVIEHLEKQNICKGDIKDNILYNLDKFTNYEIPDDINLAYEKYSYWIIRNRCDLAEKIAKKNAIDRNHLIIQPLECTFLENFMRLYNEFNNKYYYFNEISMDLIQKLENIRIEMEFFDFINEFDLSNINQIKKIIALLEKDVVIISELLDYEELFTENLFVYLSSHEINVLDTKFKGIKWRKYFVNYGMDPDFDKHPDSNPCILDKKFPFIKHYAKYGFKFVEPLLISGYIYLREDKVYISDKSSEPLKYDTDQDAIVYFDEFICPMKKTDDIKKEIAARLAARKIKSARKININQI